MLGPPHGTHRSATERAVKPRVPRVGEFSAQHSPRAYPAAITTANDAMVATPANHASHRGRGWTNPMPIQPATMPTPNNVGCAQYAPAGASDTSRTSASTQHHAMVFVAESFNRGPRYIEPQVMRRRVSMPRTRQPRDRRSNGHDADSGKWGPQPAPWPKPLPVTGLMCR